MLGHSSIEMTLNRYSHLMPNVAEALAEKAGRAVRRDIEVAGHRKSSADPLSGSATR
jgi:hypothetical protein